MHFSHLMQERPRSFCIVTDNALAPNSIMSKPVPSGAPAMRAVPRRVKSAQKANRNKRVPRVTSLPMKLLDEEPLSSNRWSSAPSSEPSTSRRGLSEEAQDGLHNLASKKDLKKNLILKKKSVDAPQKPVRKVLDDEDEYAMSLTKLSKRQLGKPKKCSGLTGVRSLRRPLDGCEMAKRNIMDILGEALDSLDVVDEPEMS